MASGGERRRAAALLNFFAVLLCHVTQLPLLSCRWLERRSVEGGSASLRRGGKRVLHYWPDEAQLISYDLSKVGRLAVNHMV